MYELICVDDHNHRVDRRTALTAEAVVTVTGAMQGPDDGETRCQGV